MAVIFDDFNLGRRASATISKILGHLNLPRTIHISYHRSDSVESVVHSPPPLHTPLKADVILVATHTSKSLDHWIERLVAEPESIPPIIVMVSDTDRLTHWVGSEKIGANRSMRVGDEEVFVSSDAQLQIPVEGGNLPWTL